MSSDTSLIRPARPADAEAIARVHVYGWQEAYAGLLPDDFLAGLGRTLDRRRDFWEGLARSLSRRDAFFVAEVGGEIVGFAHGGHSRDHPDENVGEVTAIYLRRAHWGRGIGRRLFAAVVDRLREAGFEEAILWVLDTNARARRFYEAAGWEADGSEKVETLGDLELREVRYRARF